MACFRIRPSIGHCIRLLQCIWSAIRAERFARLGGEQAAIPRRPKSRGYFPFHICRRTILRTAKGELPAQSLGRDLHTPLQVDKAVPGQPTCCHPDREGNKARAVPACGVEPRHDSEGHFTQQGMNLREHNSAAGTHGRPDCEAAKELILLCAFVVSFDTSNF